MKNKQPKFKDKLTEKFATGERVKQFESFKDQAFRRLDILDAAINKNDLVKLPSNHFETLKGNKIGQFSIRINQKWRICFEWPEDAEKPFNIEIIDYH